VIEDLPDPIGQLAWLERLGQKAEWVGHHLIGERRTVRVAGDQQHLCVRPALTDLLAEFVARLLGHDHVAEHQADPRAVLLHADQRLVGAPGLQHLVTGSAELASRAPPDHLVIVDHEHRTGCRQSAGPQRLGLRRDGDFRL